MASSAGTIFSRSSFRLVRPTCVEIFIAATVRPEESTIGAAMDRSPSSSSWSFTAHPCLATFTSSARINFSSVRVNFVYAVKADNHVEIRPVTTGRAWGAKVVIESGLRPGETVVTDGQMRIFPGAQIVPVDPAKLGTGPL